MLQQSNIVLNKDLKTKDEVLRFIAGKAKELGITDNEEELLKDLWKREEEYSTGIQDGFAIPHAKSKYVKKPSILYIKTNEYIEWETLDGSNVRYIFNLLAPDEEGGNTHLQMLSKVATCLMDEDFTKEVKNTNDESQLVKYILSKMEEE